MLILIPNHLRQVWNYLNLNIYTINNCKSRNAKISFKANFAHKYCISQCGAKNNHNNSNNNSINNNQICAGINLQNAIYQIHIVKCASQNPFF